MLDENYFLINTIMEYQQKGRVQEVQQWVTLHQNLREKTEIRILQHCFVFTFRYQSQLHRNLVYLATIADSNQNMQGLLTVRNNLMKYVTD